MKVKCSVKRLSLVPATLTLIIFLTALLHVEEANAQDCTKRAIQFTQEVPIFVGFTDNFPLSLPELRAEFGGPAEGSAWVIEYVSAEIFADPSPPGVTDEIRSAWIGIRTTEVVDGDPIETDVRHYLTVNKQGFSEDFLGLPSTGPGWWFSIGQPLRLYADSTKKAEVSMRAQRNFQSEGPMTGRMRTSISGYLVDLTNRDCRGVGYGR